MSVYDGMRVGTATMFRMDDAKEVTCKLYGDDDLTPESETARLWMPPGLRSRPMDDPSEGYYAAYVQLGNEIEVLALTNRDATFALGELASGATQLYSHGKKPQAVTVEDTRIRWGTDAKEAAVLGDTMMTAEVGLWGTVSNSFVKLTTDAGTAAGATMDSASKTFFQSVGTELGKVTSAIKQFTDNKAKYLSTLNKVQ